MNVGFCCSANTGASVCRIPSENVTFEFFLASIAMANMSSSSWLFCEMEGKLLYRAVFCGVLPPVAVENSTQNSSVIIIYAICSLFFSLKISLSLENLLNTLFSLS